MAHYLNFEVSRFYNHKAPNTMEKTLNRQYFLASRPVGEPSTENIHCRDVPMTDLAPGEVRMRNLYISLDPAIRGWMGDDPNYIEPITIGDAVRCSVIGRVVESASDDFAPGDVAMTMGGRDISEFVRHPAMPFQPLPSVRLTS